MKKVPEAKAVGYTAVVIIVTIVVGAIIGAISAAVIGMGMLGVAGGMRRF
jgi:preprotein translocase subunit SecE